MLDTKYLDIGKTVYFEIENRKKVKNVIHYGEVVELTDTHAVIKSKIGIHNRPIDKIALSKVSLLKRGEHAI